MIILNPCYCTNRASTGSINKSYNVLPKNIFGNARQGIHVYFIGMNPDSFLAEQ